MITIETPIDPDCGAQTDQRFCRSYSSPNMINESKNIRRRRKGKLFMKDNQKQNKKQDNYFQKMYKQTKKKIYVGMFIRKLKQTIAHQFNFEHPLCEHQNDKYYNSIKTLKWNINFECIFLILLILINWVGCLATTLQIAFNNVRESLQYVYIIYILCGISEIFYNIFIRSKIRAKKSKRNLDYVRESFGQYLESGWLIIDCIIATIFILNLIIKSEILIYLKLINIIKIKHVNEKMKNLEIIFIQNNFKEQYWELIKVFIFNFLFAHFLAIILAILGNGNNQGWIQYYSFDDTWYIVYIWAYYWATNIMLTVGFGDITATNVQQALCLIFIETLSCVVLAYNINSIGNIIQKITSYQQQKSANLKIFTHMQNQQGISEDVKTKITDFIIQSSQLKKKFNVKQQQQFLKKLPNTFYEQFKIQSTQKIFETVPFFRNLSCKKIQQLAIKVQKKLAHPEQVLIQKNTIPKILIINNGKIGLHMRNLGTKSDGRQVQIIKADKQEYKLVSQYFLINKPVNYQIKCKDYSITYSISNKQLKEILSTNPYCYEYYCMSRDRDRFNPNDLQIELCEICSNKYCKAFHTLFDCPKLHFQPLRNLVVQRAIKKNPGGLKRLSKHKKQHHNKIKMNPLIIYAELEDIFNNNGLNKASTRKLLKSVKNVDSFEEQEIDQLNESVIQELAYMKAKFLISLSKKNSTQNDSEREVKMYCEKIGYQIGEQIKQEFMKNVCYQTSKSAEMFWDIDTDTAHDFAFYFQKQNPNKLGDKFRKKNISKKMKLNQDK